MRSGQYVKQIAGYKAFIPNSLPPFPALEAHEDLTKKLTQAELLLAALDHLGHTLPNIDLFISMYVKKEALLSSQIEGFQCSLENLFTFENGITEDDFEDIQEVVNYVKALNYGVERLKEFPMSLRLIRELHALLLDQTRGKDKTPGEFKRSQNWIGAPGSTLKNAAFVPPPPDEALNALDDLEKYLHAESSYPELIDCAFIHYQFETIHPFLDGNGRIGRLLITLYLYWKGTVKRPLLYLSYYFKKNRQEYYDRLTMTRNSGNYEQWVSFFLDGIIETSQSALESTKQILELQDYDHRRLIERKAGAYAFAMLNHLYSRPVITILHAKEELNVSFPTASHAVSQLMDAGILTEATGKKRSRCFIHKRYLEILSEGTTPFTL